MTTYAPSACSGLPRCAGNHSSQPSNVGQGVSNCLPSTCCTRTQAVPSLSLKPAMDVPGFIHVQGTARRADEALTALRPYTGVLFSGRGSGSDCDGPSAWARAANATFISRNLCSDASRSRSNCSTSAAVLLSRRSLSSVDSFRPSPPLYRGCPSRAAPYRFLKQLDPNTKRWSPSWTR